MGGGGATAARQADVCTQVPVRMLRAGPSLPGLTEPHTRCMPPASFAPSLAHSHSDLADCTHMSPQLPTPRLPCPALPWPGYAQDNYDTVGVRESALEAYRDAAPAAGRLLAFRVFNGFRALTLHARAVVTPAPDAARLFLQNAKPYVASFAAAASGALGMCHALGPRPQRRPTALSASR